MQAFFQAAVGWLTPLFVVSAMLNVGLTQKPENIFRHLRNWQYLARMALVNFVVVPALMIYWIDIFGIAAPYAIGLVIFSAAAGAPLLIKLTARSQNEIAAGATVQMVLMISTVLILPLLLPLLLAGVTVDSWTIASGLLIQMILPMGLGMVLLTFAEPFTAVVQPWIARISNIALYAMLIATILGNLDALGDPQMWGAMLTGVLALMVAFFVGHNTGIGQETDSQIGALGTAQRNTAAAVIVAQSNFADPLVLLTTVLLNTIMMFILLFLATLMAKDIRMALLEPLEADPPQRNPTDQVEAR
jgi:BASS family bile acid:Na+ symporter